MIRRIRQLDAKKRSPGSPLVQLDSEESPEPMADQLSASHAASTKEIAEQVRQALQLLPDREREAIILRRYMELDIHEVTEELGLPSTGAARALLSRAQARLAGILSRNASGEP